MSSCLLPQFKWPLLHRHQHHQHHQHHVKELHFRAQCALSTTAESPPATTVLLDLEKLRLSTSLEADSNPVVANEAWTYTEAIGPPIEETFQTTLTTETLITNDEAMISAAAAEALALARAAVRVAKEAVALAKSDCNTTTTATTASSAPTISFSSIRSQLTEADRAHILGDDCGDAGDEFQQQFPEECLEPTSEELTILEEQKLQDYEDTAVRSTRQMERKIRRDKAAEKDLLKLKRLEEELKERYGGEPTFKQWARAAGIDSKTLQKRLSHGVFCKDKMVKSNLRLVISIAKNYQNSGLNLEDLVQEGCLGLLRSVEKFDASKGFKFSTYAHWWIKQSLRKALSERSRMIHIPLHLVNDAYKVKSVRRQLENQHDTVPTNEELAKAAGMSMKRVEAVLAIPKQPTSLDQKIGDTNLKPSEITADPNAISLDEILMKSLLKKDLQRVLDSLNPREREVIRWRFGLDDGRIKTLQEIGEMVGVSRERVRQIETSAYQKLKRKKWTKQLQQYAKPIVSI
ncbi:RNA polymerase sigma factor sigB [Linum perenne]